MVVRDQRGRLVVGTVTVLTTSFGTFLNQRRIRRITKILVIGEKERGLRTGNLNSVDVVPSEKVLRSNKAVRYYGSNKKADLVSGLKYPKKILGIKDTKENVIKDVFVTLPGSSLKAFTIYKKGNYKNI